MNVTLGSLLRVCGSHVTVVVGDTGHSVLWRFKNDKKLHWDCNRRVMFFEPLHDDDRKCFNCPNGGIYVMLSGGCCRG